jgi:molybdenum cofactor biosynthesis enzyme MoaA
VTLTEHLLMESVTKLKEQVALLEKSNAANEELAAEAIAQRDEYKRQLQELLAVIHRDGGHHTEARGIGLSCLDAQEKVRGYEPDRHCSECFRLRALLRGFGL